jgi:hypothetical protein
MAGIPQGFGVFMMHKPSQTIELSEGTIEVETDPDYPISGTALTGYVMDLIYADNPDTYETELRT